MLAEKNTEIIKLKNSCKKDAENAKPKKMFGEKDDENIKLKSEVYDLKFSLLLYKKNNYESHLITSKMLI